MNNEAFIRGYMSKEASILSKQYFPTFRNIEAAIKKLARKKVLPGQAPGIIKSMARNPESMAMFAAPGGMVLAPAYIAGKKQIAGHVGKSLQEIGENVMKTHPQLAEKLKGAVI